MELLGGLCEDLVEEILDRIPCPIKPVIRMKCLSKCWNDFITHYRKSRFLTSTSTLLYQYNFLFDDTTDYMIFRNSGEDQMQEVSLHKALGFSVDRNVEVMGSSNGLILFRRYDSLMDHRVYVCDLAQKQPKLDTLPPLDITIDSYTMNANGVLFNMGISYDGVPDHPYKVVYYSQLDFIELNLKFHFYSSDTRQWHCRTHSMTVSEPCEIVERSYKNLSQHLSWNGLLLCLVYDYILKSGYILESDFQKNTFKLVELPSRNHRQSNSILFVSEGCLHYCYIHKEGIQIWKYVSLRIESSYYWKLIHEEEIVKIIAQRPEIYGYVEKYDMIVPLGFDEELQIVYIELHKRILCYSLETRAWTFEEAPKAWDASLHRYFVILRSRNPIGDDCLFLKECLMRSSFDRNL